jgi:hypothetical protein
MSPKNNRTVSAVEINISLSSADEISREIGPELELKYPDWSKHIDFLGEDSCPVTYLPVTCVLLMARSIRSASELDVLHIQAKTSEMGYSAPSLGKLLITFAIQQKIDLRSTSSQIMNNQPFTFKAKIEPNMAANHKAAQYAKFYRFAEEVNALSKTEAIEILALTFFKRRFDQLPDVLISNLKSGIDALSHLGEIASDFVLMNSESGKVGQAFVAALFDVAYPGFGIRMGNNNDPSVHIPGDVQASINENYWAWAEVKQKSVSTPDVQTFVERVSGIEGDFAFYFALANDPYPQNIQMEKLLNASLKKGVRLHVFVSPKEAFNKMLLLAPGSASSQASGFANAFNVRLREAAVTNELRNKWIEVASGE